jgi:hypothetical protein
VFILIINICINNGTISYQNQCLGRILILRLRIEPTPGIGGIRFVRAENGLELVAIVVGVAEGVLVAASMVEFV